MKSLLLFILFILSWQTFATKLSAIEAGIVKQVQKQLPQALSELEQVVNINSGTMNFSGVKKVGMVFKKQFEQLGVIFSLRI